MIRLFWKRGVINSLHLLNNVLYMKKYLLFAFAGICTAGTLFISCQHEPELQPGIPTVCFDEQVLPVFQTACAKSGCHDGSGEMFALNDYNSIRNYVQPGKPMASKLHKVIAANHNSFNIMPPKPDEPLIKEQIDAITLWILQGANETSCIEVCDSVNVSFKDDIMPMLDNYCRACHSGSQPQGKSLLIDYPTVKAVVEGGRFMGAVEHMDGFLPMPQNADKLSDCNLGMLRKWINDGMPDNK